MRLDFPLFPERASTVAGDVDALYFFLIAVSAFFCLLISGLVLVFAARYRRRHSADVGRDIHGSLALELTWTLIPLGIVLFVFFWGASVFFRQFRPPQDAVEFWAVGKQWMWKFQHPEGVREVNVLHVPLGQPIRITMTSEDVIHSLFIPAFRVKADVLPGRYTSIWFEATKAGTYHLFCTEYCGAEHSRMIGQVIVQEPEEYASWLSGEKPGQSMAAAGEQLFTNLACHTCHKGDDSGRGPTLEGLFGTEVLLTGGRTVLADETYLRESIVNPAARVVQGYQPIMPTFQGQISEDGLLQLVSYLKTLAPQSEAPPKTAAAEVPAVAEETR